MLMEMSQLGACLVSVVSNEEGGISSSADDGSSGVFTDGGQAVCLEEEKKIGKFNFDRC